MNASLDSGRKDFKPDFGQKRRFEDGCELMLSPTATIPSTVEKLKPQLDEIKQAFYDGDVEKLLDIASKTAPVAFENAPEGYSLGHAQVLNDIATMALAYLIGEDYTRDLSYNYQPSFGQNSATIDNDRYVAAFTAPTNEEERKEHEAALAEIVRKNPEKAVVLARQAQAAEKIRALLGKDGELR